MPYEAAKSKKIQNKVHIKNIQKQRTTK